MIDWSSGEMVVRSMTKQRAIQKSDMDIAEVRRGSDEWAKSRELPVKVENGRYGRFLPREFQDRRCQAAMRSAITYREMGKWEIGIPQNR